MSYDGYGRLQSKHLPEQRDQSNNPTYTTYDYNADSTINWVQDGRGVRATYGYNNNRHLVNTITYSAPSGITSTPTQRLWAVDARHPTLLVGISGGSDSQIRDRVEAQVAAGVVAEASRAWAGPLSETARKVLGFEQFATLSPDVAVEAVVGATRRVARYQRKWLRRLSPAATLAGAPEEVADEILALAGTGQRLPRR